MHEINYEDFGAVRDLFKSCSQWFSNRLYLLRLQNKKAFAFLPYIFLMQFSVSFSCVCVVFVKNSTLVDRFSTFRFDVLLKRTTVWAWYQVKKKKTVINVWRYFKADLKWKPFLGTDYQDLKDKIVRDDIWSCLFQILFHNWYRTSVLVLDEYEIIG